MAVESCLVGSPTTQNVLPKRPTANYHPSIWGKSIMSYVPNEATLCEWREKAKTLKSEVLKLLQGDHGSPNKRSSQKLSLIDAIQRLGVGYHFKQQIEEELARIFRTYHDKNNIDDDDDDLHDVALRFRLLREHGYKLTCDVFTKFMNNNGSFNESISDDVDGLLGLYEATYLRVQGETILDEALNFTTKGLRSLLSHLSPSLAKQVCDALYRPLRKRIPRVEARNYLSVYEQIDKHNEVLLDFAKLDFNILQKLHLEELSIISTWWYKDLDCERNFPFVRDRIVEAYFWALGVYFEPQYTMSRKSLTKIMAMLSVIDDIYDSYGTKDELELFTEVIVDRWDYAAIVDLPDYMKACCQHLLNVFHKAKEEIIKQGGSPYGIECTKEELKRLSMAYMEERKWLDRQDRPTIEEYMKVALVSSGYPLLSVASHVLMGDFVENKESVDWLLNRPKVVMAASLICRLMNDTVSHKFEQERGNSPSSIECYTAQYNATEEKASNVFRKEVEEAWKDINEAFLRPTPVATSVLMRVLNLARVIEALYKESDHYTHVTPTLKECITSLLFSEIQV